MDTRSDVKLALKRISKQQMLMNMLHNKGNAHFMLWTLQLQLLLF